MVNCRFDDREKTKRQKLLFGLRKGGKGEEWNNLPEDSVSLRFTPAPPNVSCVPASRELVSVGPLPLPVSGGGHASRRLSPSSKEVLFSLLYSTVFRRISARPVEQKTTKTFSEPCSGSSGSAETSLNDLSDVLQHLWLRKRLSAPNHFSAVRMAFGEAGRRAWYKARKNDMLYGMAGNSILLLVR